MTLQNPPKLIIFDLDGTLLDSVSSIADSMNAALAAAGLPTHPTARYFEFVGDGVEILARRASARSVASTRAPADDPELVALVARYRQEYASRELMAEPYPGVLDALRACASRGVKLAILSNKPDANSRRIADQLFAGVSFVSVCGEREGVARKPDPQAARSIAQQQGVAADECWFVGDTSVDMRTAVAAKIHPVGVLWGFRGRDELLAHGAQVLIAHPSELVTLF